ncbi:MAG: MnmC family methyltransferase [Sulfurovaceae bacterium]|nr:MnmC family methyltransferase [Sulfurovaceae bacterium]
MPYNEALRSLKKIITTKDGSQTLYSSEFDECYHSTNDGALNETLQKHIIPAFTLLSPKNKIVILDICFGLGYNTLATIYYCKLHKISTKIEIISPELDEALVRGLKDFVYPEEFDMIKPIIDQLSQNLHYKDEQFNIDILIGDARAILPNIEQKIDIIYQDAFSPKKNPLLWTREYFEMLRGLCNDDVIMTTYSSATPVRMGMWENGFKLYTPPKSSVRSGTIATLGSLELEFIDMELKLERNPDAKSLKDSEYQ